MTTKQNMIEAIATCGSVTVEQAAKVLAVFVKAKAIKVTAHEGYSVVHGAFMDRCVIARALSQTK